MNDALDWTVFSERNDETDFVLADVKAHLAEK
jgi:hypothetical protein